MNTDYRKPLPGTELEYFDTRAVVDDIHPGAYDTLPYTSRVLAEQLLRRCDPALLTDSLKQLIERRRDMDFPWYPARVVYHDILGQTALVDLAGLRDAIAERGGDPAKVNPVVPTQLIVDHSLAVEHAGFEKDAFEQNRAIEDRRNDDRFHFIDWTKTAFENVDVIPPGNGIMHQINLEKMSPVVQKKDGVAFPDTCVGTDSHTPMVDALGVISVGVGGLEAESVMLGRASMMRLPDIVGVELTGRLQPGITSTDMVLAMTEFLRQARVVGAYLEFFGEGANALTVGDRATISNMTPEYGASAAMFYIDGQTIDYLKLTGRDDDQVALVEAYAKETGLWADSLKSVKPEQFRATYIPMFDVDKGARAQVNPLYEWRPQSTYIRRPPYWEGGMVGEKMLKGMRPLAILPDNITTDHLSPSNAIMLDSAAGEYLAKMGLPEEDFNSYATHRGDHLTAQLATFAVAKAIMSRSARVLMEGWVRVPGDSF
jgi:aconitate hydratase